MKTLLDFYKDLQKYDFSHNKLVKKIVTQSVDYLQISKFWNRRLIQNDLRSFLWRTSLLTMDPN